MTQNLPREKLSECFVGFDLSENRAKGMGLYTSEEIIGNMTGKRWTVGPGKFEI